MKKLTKKQWGLLLAGIVLLGGGGTYAYASNQSNAKIAEAKEQLSESSDKIKKLTAEIQALLDTKDDNYLAKDVTDTQIQALQEKVKKETATPGGVELPKDSYTTFNKESKKAQDLMEKVTLAYKTQTSINELYEKTDKKQAVNGSIVTKDLPIADNLTKETVEKSKKTYYIEGATTSYDKTMNALITGAEEQLAQVTKAKEAVAKVFKDGKVVSTESKLYDSAKAETEKIKNEKVKKELLDQLAKVKTDIDKKASEEKAKAEAEEKKAADTSSAQAAATTPGATEQATNQPQANNAATTDNGYTADNGGGYDASAQGANNGGGYTPPATGGGNTGGGGSTPQAPSQPTTDGGGRGEMTQDDLNQASKDAADDDWSGFFK